MSDHSSFLAELQEIEDRVRALRIRVATASDQGTAAGSAAPVPWSAAWEEQLICAQTAEEITAVDLSPIDSLQRGRGHLSTVDSWDERARLGRALRSGILAKRCLLSGDYRVEPLPTSLPLRATIFVCLHCPEHPQGFWSRKSRPFLELVGDPTGKGLGPRPPHSVFAVLPSEKEASAYLLGAGRSWPVEVEATAGRPSLDATIQAAEAWVQSMMDPDTGAEYLSAEEIPDGLEHEFEEPAEAAAEPMATELQELRARLAAMEQMLKRGAEEPAAPAQVDRGQQPLLFGQGTGERPLTAGEMRRLQDAVGPPPRRLGRAEGVPAPSQAQHALVEATFHAEQDRGVIDEEEFNMLDPEVGGAQLPSNDPLHRLLFMQLQQTNNLARALVPKPPADPIAAMLNASDSGAASSGSGSMSVKGYVARDAFLRQVQDDKKLVELIKQNACTELGVQKGMEDPSLLRQFLEQRVPIGDHKTLAQFGYILAWGWEKGAASNNVELMAFCGRMSMYVEQCALDSGRSGLAWLLTGLPEPNFQQVALNKKRTSLTPFSKLSPASWVAANLSYLKDVDTFESRLKTLGAHRNLNQPAVDPDSEEKPTKPKPKAKKPKGKGGEKGSKGAEAPPTEPPPEAQAGEPLSDSQYEVLETLQGHLRHFCDIPAFQQADLGRFGEKFDALRRALQELPQRVDVDLSVLLQEIKVGFDTYAKYESPHFAAPKDVDHEDHDDLTPQHVTIKNLGHKPVIASRIKWKHPPTFDPRPYLLDPITKAVFTDPDTLRLPRVDWPDKPKARVQCSRPELLKLMKIWDAHSSLALFPCSEVDPHEAVGIFSVPKDQTYDRLIINPTVINSRMMPYSSYTKRLAPGSLLALLTLKPDEAFRFCADDLSDFYYTFKVPRARAKRNCIGTRVFPSEVAHLSCYDPTVPGPYYPSLATLAMGDGHAVEIAQGAHHALLQLEAGCMLDDEVLEYRRPIPRGNFIELLAIDDHIGVQRVPLAQVNRQIPHRDTLVFADAQAAYTKVGLKSHPGKARRCETKGTILGADFDGIRGRVSAPRDRTILLMWLTALVAKLGTCTRQVLCSLLGCWVHVILFRRPLLALIDALFKEGIGNAPTKVFKLSSHARHELISLVVLGPCAQADLRVNHCPKVFSLDASPYGGAIVTAETTTSLTQELWRHAEQRGYHTNLVGPAGSILRELGLDSVEELEHNHHKTPGQIPLVHTIPPSLQEGILYDCVELFRGSGGWSAAHSKQGMSVHHGYESNHTRLFFKDLADRSVFQQVIALALRRVVREWHAGPPCLTFGTLRRPRIRNVSHPAGFNLRDPLTAQRNLLAMRTAMLGLIVIASGAYFSCEQPGSSVMFRMHLFRILVSRGCVITRMCFCNFGSAFNKPSQWLHNKGWLLPLEGTCRCRWSGQHFVVQGTFTRASILDFNRCCIPDAKTVYGREPSVGEAVSSYSAQYPAGLMTRMAQGSKLSKTQGPPVIPLSAVVLSYKRVGMELPSTLQPPPEPSVDSDAITVESREWFEDPEWIGEIADSLPFKTLFKYKFKSPNHINVLESQVYSSWIKHCAKCYAHSRVIGLLDSRVTIGAASKGRSSSFAISRVLKKTIPYLLGSNLYPGSLHVYSKKNRADAPSRDREVETPSKSIPKWLQELQAGAYHSFDAVCQSAGYPRVIGRWVRLLLLMAGDVERNPGPKSMARVREPRGELDLAAGFTKPTAQRMQKCLDGFAVWVNTELRLNFSAVMKSHETCSLALRGYGMHLYRSGFPRYMFVYALTAVQDRFPQHRPFLASAWHIDKKWQLMEPGECRPVISLPVFKAILCLGLLWNWNRFVAVTMIAFAGMLHPAEFIPLTRGDLMLPRDTFHTTDALYVHLKNPKTFRFARQQHVKISDPDIIHFVDALFGNLPIDFKLFGGTIHMYRNQWNAIMQNLGIPYRQVDRGITPGTLRGSGATSYYLLTENIPLICWRGRWSRVRTLEFYLQEVAAQVLVHSLTPASRARIEMLHHACYGVFISTLQAVCSKLAAQIPSDG
eukprot:Skav220890  [mRNA]  locus=scaffold3880:13453:20349:+ [translate_table: standard]